MNITNKQISELKDYENNPRLINDEAIEKVAASIKEFGFKVPIIVDENNVIVAGHTRKLAAQSIGMDEVPVIIADDLTEEQIKAFRLADNKVAEFSEWDHNALAKELTEIENMLDEDFMKKFEFETMNVTPDDFDTDFELPAGEQGDMRTMSFTLHVAQKELIEQAIESVGYDEGETFGNTNKNGNALFKVVQQWAEQKKLY